MFNQFNWKFFPCLVVTLSLQGYLCAAGEDGAFNNIDNISQQIIDKEVELDKLITNTHLKNEIITINKIRRQFLGAMINSVGTEAGLIDATQLFFSHTRFKNDKVSGGANAGQLYPQIIGQEINAASNLFELTNNVLYRLKAAKNHLDPKHSLQHVKQLINSIDAGLSRRSVLVNNLSEQNEMWASLSAEGKVLQDLRNALLSEYQRIYIRTRKEFA